MRGTKGNGIIKVKTPVASTCVFGPIPRLRGRWTEEDHEGLSQDVPSNFRLLRGSTRSSKQEKECVRTYVRMYICTRARTSVTCFRVIQSIRRRRLARGGRGESFLCLTLRERLPSLFLLPLVPLRSSQRRILPCSTCLSRV